MNFVNRQGRDLQGKGESSQSRGVGAAGLSLLIYNKRLNEFAISRTAAPIKGQTLDPHEDFSSSSKKEEAVATPSYGENVPRWKDEKRSRTIKPE